MRMRLPVVATACLLLLAGCAIQRPNPEPASTPACQPAPFGEVRLYLRGSMNNWAALDEYALQYRCDAYYLNVEFDARHDFKIADSAWSAATTFGSAVGGAGDVAADTPFVLTSNATAGVTANLRHAFAGVQTLRLTHSGTQTRLQVGPLSFVDPNLKQVSDPAALSVQFDSRASADKAPFGALPAGNRIDFSLRSSAAVDAVTLVVEQRHLEGNQEVLAYHELARVPLQRRAQGDQVRWQGSYQFATTAVYGYWFVVQIADQHYAYQNNRDPIFWTRERGSGGLGEIGFLGDSLASIRRFRQTVYAADYSVPEWAPDIVYYYIFPERFRNGDTTNDPAKGARQFHRQGIEVHADWNEHPFVPGSGDGSDAYSGNDFSGGDIAGIIEKLDYIRDLGANTLYLTPLFCASSNHKYDTADYRRIDPAFGSEADFSRLTAEAAKRGIRVIPDTSLNHSGSDSIYFDRYAKYPELGAFDGEQIQPASPYASWYRFHPEQSEANRQYTGWTGVADLPELDKSSADYRRFAYADDDSVMRHWLKLGAAGWRMDVAPWVPDDFWRDWRKAVKAERADALTVAETWFDASKYFLGDTFDSTMNYIFRNAVLEYVGGGDARKLYRNLEWLREAYPEPAFYALMNLLSTHDQARSLHLLGYTDDADADAIALAKRRLLLAIQFQMAYPGAPTLYYGDEVGLTGGDDPQNRRTYPWADRGGHPDLGMLEQVRGAIQLRRRHPVLRRGSLQAPLLVDEHLIVLARRLGPTLALTASNNALTTQSAVVGVPACAAEAEFVDAQSAERLQARAGRLELSLSPLSARVLIADVSHCGSEKSSSASTGAAATMPSAVAQSGVAR